MEIKTKFNIDQEVYYLDINGSIELNSITSISIHKDTFFGGILIRYELRGCKVWKEERDLFNNKEEINNFVKSK